MNYDFSQFHPDCKNKQIVNFPDGVHITCLDCGISANVEAIADKIAPKDAVKVGKDFVRVPMGKRSPNVVKGAYVE